MPNLLTFPSKRPYPADVRSALQAYIHGKHPETHPDAFSWDIAKWESCRSEAIADNVHEDRIAKILTYNAQLVFVLTKLPADIGLPFAYDAMFAPGVSLALSNIAYERMCLLLNLASLYCHLATDEVRSTMEEIKRAVTSFVRAATVISYIISSALPAFQKTLIGSGTVLPPEFDEDVLQGFRLLLLAQGQECAWQKASLDQVKNGLLARLAIEASSLYNQSLQALTKNAGISSEIPKSWQSHIMAKANHFAAVAQFRQSMDDNDARRYGLEISRLKIASSSLKKAMDAARGGGVARAVMEDARSLEAALKNATREAEQGNDLIYHKDIPPASSTPLIKGTAIVREDPTHDLFNSASRATRKDEIMFAGLESWGITRACEIYRDRRENWIDDELVETQHELDQASSSVLNTMHLPAALDALSQPVGLPPSLLSISDQIRQEDGPNRLQKFFKDVRVVSETCRDIIDSCFDLLDEEAAEDTELRDAYAKYDQWTRLSSGTVNKILTEKLRHHIRMLTQAKNTDSAAAEKWDEWKERIEILSKEPAAIEAIVPKTTYSPREALSSPTRSVTQTHAAELRNLLDQLGDLRIARMQIVERAKRVAATDDIKPRILRYAAETVRDQWADVDPASFAEVIDAELAKYDTFQEDLKQNGGKQEDLLARVEDQNRRFLESRKADPSIKDREVILKDLDLAYHEYRDIERHLREGLKFYNDFAEQAARLKAETQDWVKQRRDSIRWLTDSLDPVDDLDEEDINHRILPKPDPMPTIAAPTSNATPSVSEAVAPKTGKKKAKATVEPTAPALDVTPHSTAPIVTPTTPSRKPALRLDLPNPNSSAWKSTELPPAPPSAIKKTRSRTKDNA